MIEFGFEQESCGVFDSGLLMGGYLKFPVKHIRYLYIIGADIIY